MLLFEKQKSYLEYISNLKKTSKDAKSQGKTECLKCGLCCTIQACDFNKEDIYNVAKHFNLSPKEFFLSKLVIQKYSNEIQTITPIRTSQYDISGQYKPLLRTYDTETPCTFLKVNNECSIHHIKPKGGRIAKCWEKQKFEETAITWTNQELDELLIELNIDINRIDKLEELL